MAETPRVPITEADFIARYGDVPYTKHGLDLTLKKALAAEAAMCTVAPEARQDEAVRLNYMARQIGEQALLPEHQHLLEQTSNPNRR